MAVAFLALPLVALVRVEGSSGGITGYSGNPSTGSLDCNKCHDGGVTPTVTLSGPTVVEPGSTHTYTLHIEGGQERAGGLDVSASAGTLSVVDAGTQLLEGEIIHSVPQPVNPVTFDSLWSFNWTAPLTAGSATLYGAGNSVNLFQGPGGDAAQTDVLVITVATPGTPGETSGPAGSPLRVADVDVVSGDLTLEYATACETTDNNIYYGALAQVSTLTWSGEVCGIGVSGSYAGFDPGAGSYFFVVVGNQGGAEGSYGQTRELDGSGVERPPFVDNTCGETQDLSAPCDW
jgi:hypothetical protein